MTLCSIMVTDSFNHQSWEFANFLKFREINQIRPIKVRESTLHNEIKNRFFLLFECSGQGQKFQIIQVQSSIVIDLIDKKILTEGLSHLTTLGNFELFEWPMDVSDGGKVGSVQGTPYSVCSLRIFAYFWPLNNSILDFFALVTVLVKD